MNLKFFYKEQDEKRFWQYWQEYLIVHNIGSRYSRQNPEMFIAASKFRSLFHSDKSFVALSDGKPVALAFLPIEKNDNCFSLSSSGGFVIAPLFKDLIVAKEIFSEIDRLARENEIAKIMLAADVFFNNGCGYNYLHKFGYLEASVLSWVIDLNVSEDGLLKNCRRGHRSDIKKVLNDKNYRVFIIDKDNADYNLHEEYRELHRRCSGKITRPKENFDLQFEKLKAGEAILSGLNFKEKNIAFSYFEFKGEFGVYESSADDPDYAGLPLYHGPVYSAMKHLQSKGVRFIDTGQPSSPTAQFGYYPDQKQINIALFKRGFGGDFRPNFRGVKYFSEYLLNKDMELFTREAAKNIGGK